MSKTGHEKSAKQHGEHDDRFPDWYWKIGLHDAVILSVSEIELVPDWKSKPLRRNCLEICLDCRGARESVRKICLYNYKIKTPEININELERPWWFHDKVTQLPNDRYVLEIIIETACGNKKQFEVEFEIPEVER